MDLEINKLNFLIITQSLLNTNKIIFLFDIIKLFIFSICCLSYLCLNLEKNKIISIINFFYFIILKLKPKYPEPSIN